MNATLIRAVEDEPRDNVRWKKPDTKGRMSHDCVYEKYSEQIWSPARSPVPQQTPARQGPLPSPSSHTFPGFTFPVSHLHFLDLRPHKMPVHTPLPQTLGEPELRHGKSREFEARGKGDVARLGK